MLLEASSGDNDDEISDLEWMRRRTAVETSRLFLRNLPYSCTVADLEEAFSPFGQLVQVCKALASTLPNSPLHSHNGHRRIYRSIPQPKPLRGWVLSLLPQSSLRLPHNVSCIVPPSKGAYYTRCPRSVDAPTQNLTTRNL